MDSFRYLEFCGELVGRVCSRKGLALGEGSWVSQVFPSQLAILHNFCGMLFNVLSQQIRQNSDIACFYEEHMGLCSCNGLEISEIRQ